MSTRRARIKGVTALPPRRKNTDVKKQQESEIIKTPKTRRVSFDKSVNNLTPRGARGSPRKSPRQVSKTPERKVFTPTSTEKDRRTPSIERVVENVFVSPRVRASPRRRSSIVRTPVIEVDVRTEKLITSQGVQDVCERLEVNNVVGSTATPISMVKESGNTTDEESAHSEVMDGIVPLQPVKVPPKPIDLLKNEIISEHAEVSFDPIIPLPSPNKVRPKLRPVPRLGPLRRSSIQGSASESEDENRRALQHGSATPVPMRQRERYDSNITLPATNRDLNRVRNDSISSNHSPTTSSPFKEKEKNHVASRRVEVSRRMAALRKHKQSVQRDTLTMYDLIFYNPATNPIIPDQEEIKAREANMKEEEERKLLENNKKEVEPKAAPVPQIKLGPNGEIMLDEQSLVIKASVRPLAEGVVREGAWAAPRGSYRRAARSPDWSAAETVLFYRAVAAIGTDFSLMQPLFPTRTRRDLKLKFKKEEKINAAQLDKALRTGARWDVTTLEMEFNNERKLTEERKKEEKARLKEELEASKKRRAAMKKLRVRNSRGSSALESSILPTTSTTKNDLPSTADDFIQHVQDYKKSLRKKRPRKTKEPKNTNTKVTSRKSLTKEKEKTYSDRSESPLFHVPTNIENGSLVVLAVDDPQSPSKKMFQTYISHEGGELTPVNLSSQFLNSVVGYMKKGGSSPQVNSPSTSDRATPIDLTPNRRRKHNNS